MRNSCLYSNRPKTFRRSSTAIFEKWGSNLQNIEKSLREIYIPDGYTDELKGKCNYFLQTGDLSVFTEEELMTVRVFLQCDQSGAEALIVAYESEDGPYRRLFQNRVKVHVYVAMHLFKDIWHKKLKEHNIPVGDDFDIEEFLMLKIEHLREHRYWKALDDIIKESDKWPTQERYYYFAKQTCHSANYGIEENTFVLNILEKSGGKVVIPQREGGRFLNVYRTLFPEIPARNQRIQRQVEETKMLFNIFGFPYNITNYNITQSEMKEYYAWSAQSTVGELTRIAVSDMQEHIESYKNDWDILADTHDSFLEQCFLIDTIECSQKMQEVMNQKMVSPVDGVEFRMQSEVNIGFDWCNLSHPKWLDKT